MVLIHFSFQVEISQDVIFRINKKKHKVVYITPLMYFKSVSEVFNQLNILTLSINTVKKFKLGKGLCHVV
jgi:hypothetical protein